MLTELQIETIVAETCGTYRTGDSYTFEDVWNCIEKALAAHSAGAPEPVAEIVRWLDFTHKPRFDIKVIDETLEHGAKLYSQPMPDAAQEPVAWRYQSEDPLDGGEWLLSDTKPNRHNIQPLYTHPQPLPMPQTDAARDAEDAKRYRFIKSQMKVGAVQTQLPLYRTLHWIGYEDCSDVCNADAVIDAEIECLDRAKGE